MMSRIVFFTALALALVGSVILFAIQAYAAPTHTSTSPSLSPLTLNVTVIGVGGVDGHQPLAMSQAGPGLGGLDADIDGWYDGATGYDLTGQPYPPDRGGLWSRTDAWQRGWATQGGTLASGGMVGSGLRCEVGGWCERTPGDFLRAGERVVDSRTDTFSVDITPSTHIQAVAGEQVVHVNLSLTLTTDRGRHIASYTNLWFNVVADPSRAGGYRYLGGMGGTHGLLADGGW